MNEITYQSSGGNIAEFYFDFPFFQTDDVKVMLNGQLLESDSYAVRGNESGAASDIPYNGGSVEFPTAPAAGVKITIFRRLKLERGIDYQPTLPISQTMLNQDMSFFIECAKEFNERLNNLLALENFDAEEITARLEAINEQIESLDDLTDFAHTSDLEPITAAITNISAALQELSEQIDNIEIPESPADYIVEQSEAGANPWYRKWNSGWCEQGGLTSSFTNTEAGSSQTKTIVLPITMQDAAYFPQFNMESNSGGWSVRAFTIQNKTPENFGIICVNNNTAGGTENNKVSWIIKGRAA
ncbi:MAG: hypothetical protein LBT45_00175 [Rickettsiales bacterium]|jgi:hypothetical protein|nr:hypothetical protein [Rickettsiales bacterium]